MSPISLVFFFLGLVLIVVGILWISRLSQTEENETETADGKRLVSVGFGQYNTEGLIMFRAIVAIVVGVFIILLGFFM